MVFADDLYNVRLVCCSFDLHSIRSLLHLSWNIISSRLIIGGALAEQGVDLDAQARVPPSETYRRHAFTVALAVSLADY